jgi:hypothetical protein
VLDGHGPVDVWLDDEQVRTVELDGPRLYELADTGAHEEHELALVFEDARAPAFSFVLGSRQVIYPTQPAPDPRGPDALQDLREDLACCGPAR